MGRRSSILDSPIQEKVDALLDAGETLEEISLRTGASKSAVWRYGQFRKANISKVFDGEPNPVDLLARLVDSADAARAARKAAALNGSHAGVTRALGVEAAILSKLVSELDVTSSTILDVASEVTALTEALGSFAAEHPEAARSLADHLAANSPTKDLGRALSNRLETTT